MQKKCFQCQEMFEASRDRLKFCNHSCATKYNNTRRPKNTTEQKAKISASLKEHYRKNPKKRNDPNHSKFVGQFTKGKYNVCPNNLCELSKRTISKIFRRMNLACSRCGWNDAIGDIHHINGRKIENANGHQNLTYLCPNCHRMCHAKKIDKTQLVNLDVYIGDRWKEFYFG